MSLFNWKRQDPSSGPLKADKVTFVNKVSAKQAFFGSDAPDPESLRNYLVKVRDDCAAVPLLGLDVRAADSSGQAPMTLDQIYIGLDTTETVRLSRPASSNQEATSLVEPGGDSSRPLTALEAIVGNRHAALLGLPGSGKSTFLRHLGFCLAAHALDPDKQWLERLAVQPKPAGEPVPVWPVSESELVPLMIELRNFAAGFRERIPDRADPAHLWDYFAASLRPPYDRALPLVRAAVESGQAIVFLDGLDEVPRGRQDRLKRFVREAVEAFAESPFGSSRIVVTCRTFSYRNQGWQINRFPSFELRDFDDLKIKTFIRFWFQIQVARKQLPPGDLPGRCHSLWTGLQEPTLRQLAGNPVQLTSMAIVDCHHSRLPDSRAKLYDELIKLLLYRWDDIRFGNADGLTRLSVLLQEAGSDEKTLLRVLRRLAWQAQDGQPRINRSPARQDQTADIPEAELLDALRTLHPDDTQSLSWAENVLRTIEARSGLLVSPKAEVRVFKFPHRSYQEFLAGAHLADQRETDFLQRAVALVDDSHYWWEVLRWAAGVQVHVKENLYAGLALVAELACACDPPAPSLLAWRKLLLAGEVLVEMKPGTLRTDALGREQVAKVQTSLARLIEAEGLPAAERAQAGIALGKLGDPRLGVGLRTDGRPDLDWIEIPAGRFQMGDPVRDSVDIEQAYRISRYPVTVAQYLAFVASGAYQDDGSAEATQRLARWWTAEGLQWKRRAQVTDPKEYDPVFQTPNHPRVGVSWHEATAFCGWLTEQLEETIALPSEAQWERAARHTDGRKYPWGAEDSDLPQRCNMYQTGLGHTSAVGLFPSGNAKCGASDMSGNVWEWCENWYDNARKQSRVVRGGSWRDGYHANLSCSHRYGSVPEYRSLNLGFRVVYVDGVSRSAGGS